MKYLGGLGVFCAILISYLGYAASVDATSDSLVISQVQLGASGASKQEFVELFNTSQVDVDVSGWCVTYSDYKDETSSILRCFVKPEGVDGLIVEPSSYVTLVSQSLTAPLGMVTELFQNASTDMSGARGHVKLARADSSIVDTLAWDNKSSTPPAHPETMAAAAPATGKSIGRFASPIVDTDNNFLDFREQTPLLRPSQLIELVTPPTVIDLCQMDGVQATLPEGYGYDDAGNCELLVADVCPNIQKIQLVVPDSMMKDEDGSCLVDICQNMPGLQVTSPAGYRQASGMCIKIEDRVILITELLANRDGSDVGGEFIELYNPNDEPIAFDGYVLRVGKTFEKQFALSGLAVSHIPARGYIVIRDNELGYSLLNTTSGVQVVAPAGNVTSETVYVDPEDDMSWARIDDLWQYTDMPSPGLINQPSAVTASPLVFSNSTLAPCSAGKYRHSVTNRCRNIDADIAVLASCGDDEYRSPETNRCRKITALASSTLAACEDGYVRNMDTNRCRKVLAANTTSTPCAVGSERNSETNRCRKIAANTAAAFVKTDAPAPGAGSWAIAGIATVAMSYAVYEWRRELRSAAAWVVSKARTAL